MITPNTRIGRYLIESVLGVGGMGEVFLATDTELDRKVAIKCLSHEFSEDPERIRRFTQEAKAASALNHPNIITVYEIVKTEEAQFLATEYIDGAPLTDKIRAGKLIPETVFDIAIQIASALEAAHSAGIVHRDIKPDNIMIRPDGLVKILDFGIAKLSEPPVSAGGKDAIKSDDKDESSAHADGTDMEAATAIQSGTTPGMIIGTANYMSPEQARGQQVDQQTDIFSFGVVFYEMLSGKSPFAGGTISDTLAAVLMKEPKHLENIPAELSAIVKKTLQKDKRERYQTAKDLLDDLKEFKLELEIRSHLERTSSSNLKDQNSQILKGQTTAESKSINSIVVLPFQNIGGDAEDEYFSDGLTDEIISDLSNIRSMRVISRNSAMSLKGTAKDIKTITQELDVRYVLGGSVRKAGQNFRISVQLIDGATDANLWAEKYSGSIDDIFDIQESVSRSIAEALQITLTTGEIEQIEERPIADGRAYDLYLQAKANFNQIVPETLTRSIELLKQGLEIIGENELLYAALGYTYYSYFRWISKLDENYLRLANECLEKTFALNPVSSHGFVLKGLLSYSHGQMPEAIESLTIAVESDPTNVEALFWLIVNLNYIGKGEESKKLVERIISIDPLTPMNIFLGGFVPVYTGEFEESLPFVERALAIDESSPLLIWSAVVIKAWCGKTEEAIADADKLAEIAPGWVYTEHALFLKHAFRGEKELALQHYTPDFDKEAQYDCHFALHVAHCFALINENEKALDFLEIAVQTGMVNHPFLSRLDPLLDNIRGEQRFKDLMQEAKRLSEEIRFIPTVEQAESINVEEANTQIFHQPTTTGKRAGSTTDSEEGFRVAVLPFKYRGANDELETLAEGLSEEIVTGLSRFSYLRVIARGSTLSYESDGGDVRIIGEELGARYVMEGSLRQVGTKVRLAVQLLDAETGEHLWAETYDRKFSSEAIFELQDDLVPQIVSTVADWYGVLPHSMSEAVRFKNSEELSAYEALLRSFGYFERISPEEHAVVRDGLERAVEKAPGNPDAWAMLSMMYGEEHRFGFNVKPDSLGRSLKAAQRAVDIAHGNHFAWLAMAQALFFRKEFDSFREAAERAVSLNRLDGASIEYVGHLIAFSGDWERGSDLSERAIKLNPNHPGWYWTVLFFNAYRNKDYENARKFILKCVLRGGGAYVYTQSMLAALYGQTGESEKARATLNKINEMNPDFLSIVREEYAKWYLPELVEQMMEGLHKAGLEVGTAKDQGEQKTQIQTANPTAEELSQSIAILPFSNMSADQDNEYFCDGLAEELLNALSKIEDLKVAARTSAFSFKGKTTNVSEIGEKLGVKNVLEGSVRKSGNKVRISVRLENASDGYQLWAESYDREMEDIFDVQDEIALAVVDALKLKLFGDEKAAVLKRGTNNLDAYQLYLKGRFYFEKFTVEGYEKSVDYFKQALAIEPNYAPAFAALSKSYNFACYLGFGKTAKCFSEAKAAVDKALALDQTLAEAQHSLALIKFNYERDWISAEKAFRRAIELNYSENHEHYSMFLAVLERFDEAVAEAKLAIELTPLALVPNYIAGWGFWLAGRVDLAHEQGEKLLDMEPNFSGGHILLGMSLWNDGSYQQAIDKLEAAVKLGGGNDIKMLLGLMYGMEGERKKANQLLADFERLEERGIFTAIQQAFIYAGSGEMDRAFILLEKASERHEGSLPFLKQFSSICPEFHNDPRMTDLLNRLGLPTDKTKQSDESPDANTVLLKSEPTAEERDLPQTPQDPGNDTAAQSLEAEPQESLSDSPERQSLSAHRAAQPRRLDKRLLVIPFLLAVIVIGGFLGYRYFYSGSKQIESIAVMPFVNESGNEDVEYLSDGMTETLISSLSNLPNLSVKPRSTVFRYKGTKTDPKTIAKELDVQAILNGRVVQRGQDITLYVELMDISSDKVVWSENYKRKQSDLVTLQSEIARDVSNNLKNKLSGTEEAKVTKTYTANAEAYQLYLKGRYYWNKRTLTNIRKSIDQFKAAVEKDPNYALAYVGLADSYVVLPFYGTPSGDVLPTAKTYAERALEIDDSLSEAHTSLAFVNTNLWNWDEAEKGYKRAIELNPDYSHAHKWYGDHLGNLGRLKESLKEHKRAQELEPMSLIVILNVAERYLALGDLDAALKQSQQAVELDPNWYFVKQLLGLIYLKQGQNAKAIAEAEKSVELSERQSWTLGVLGYIYAQTGRQSDAVEILRELEKKYAKREAKGHDLARVHLGLGDKDKAFDWLEKDFQSRDSTMAFWLHQVPLNSLSDDLRFKDLKKRMNMPE